MTGAVAAAGAAAAVVAMIAQMNPDASTIAAGAPIEVDLGPIAEGHELDATCRSIARHYFTRTASER